MIELNPAARAQLVEAENDAVGAFKRWTARRRRKTILWITYPAVFLAGAGLAALLIAALRWVP